MLLISKVFFRSQQAFAFIKLLSLKVL